MPLDRLCAQKLKHKGYSFICDCTEHMGSKGRSHLMNYMPRKAANGRIEVTSVMEGSRVFLWFQPLLAERNSFSPAPPLKAGFLCKNRIVSISSWSKPCPMASHSHAQPKATKGYIFPACLLGKGGALFLVACLCSQSLLLGRAPEIWKETDHDQCLCKPGWLMHRPKGWLNNPFPQKCIFSLGLGDKGIQGARLTDELSERWSWSGQLGVKHHLGGEKQMEMQLFLFHAAAQDQAANYLLAWGDEVRLASLS